MSATWPLLGLVQNNFDFIKDSVKPQEKLSTLYQPYTYTGYKHVLKNSVYIFLRNSAENYVLVSQLESNANTIGWKIPQNK